MRSNPQRVNAGNERLAANIAVVINVAMHADFGSYPSRPRDTFLPRGEAVPLPSTALLCVALLYL